MKENKVKKQRYEVIGTLNNNGVVAKDELNKEELKNYKYIGITAGASTPDWIIKEVINIMEGF